MRSVSQEAVVPPTAIQTSADPMVAGGRAVVAGPTASACPVAASACGQPSAKALAVHPMRCVSNPNAAFRIAVHQNVGITDAEGLAEHVSPARSALRANARTRWTPGYAHMATTSSKQVCQAGFLAMALCFSLAMEEADQVPTLPAWAQAATSCGSVTFSLKELLWGHGASR